MCICVVTAHSKVTFCVAMNYFTIILVFTALSVNAYGKAGNTAVEETSSKNVTYSDSKRAPSAAKGDESPSKSRPGKIYSDLIRISNKQSSDAFKYDTASGNEETDSKTTQSEHPESKILILDNGRTYEVNQYPFRSPNPHLSSAVGAISAHIIRQAQEEYIPYPPNGNPQDYIAYRGQGYADESPLTDTYERASKAGYGHFVDRSTDHYQEIPDHFNHYRHGCYVNPSFYPENIGRFERESLDERNFGSRRNKEPIKRHIPPSLGQSEPRSYKY